MSTKEYFNNPAGQNVPLVLAHRGYQYGQRDNLNLAGLQNTLESFGAAADLGVHYIETDVRVTADGELICFHDPVLDDLTDMPGIVARLDWETVQGAKVRGRASIPRLAEAVEAFPRMKFNVDVKVAEAAAPLAALIEEKRLQDRVLVGSFSDASSKAVQKRVAWPVATSGGTRSTTLLALAGSWAPEAVLRAAWKDLDAFQVPEKSGKIPVVTARTVKRAHELGKQVHVWTVNDTGAMHRLLDLGVDGLVTDRPDLAFEVLRERGAR